MADHSSTAHPGESRGPNDLADPFRALVGAIGAMLLEQFPDRAFALIAKTRADASRCGCSEFGVLANGNTADFAAMTGALIRTSQRDEPDPACQPCTSAAAGLGRAIEALLGEPSPAPATTH